MFFLNLYETVSSKKVPSRQCHPGFSPIPRLLVTCLDEANHKQKLSDGSCQIIDNRTKLLVNDTWNVNITIASKTSLVKQGGMNTNKINTVRISLCVKAVFLYERAWSKVKKVVVFIRKFFTVSLKKNDYTNLINTNRFNTAGLALRCFVYAFNSSSSSSNMITCSKSVIFSCLRCPSSNSLPSLQKKRNSSLKKGHNFQRWYILTCWDTSCFRLRLKYWSVKKSLKPSFEMDEERSASFFKQFSSDCSSFFWKKTNCSQDLTRYMANYDWSNSLNSLQFPTNNVEVDFECYFAFFFANWSFLSSFWFRWNNLR